MRIVLPIIAIVASCMDSTHGTCGRTLSGPNGWGLPRSDVFGLFVVVALIFVLSFFVKRYGQLGASSELKFKVLTSLALSQRERLVLVQIGEKQVVLGVAPGHVSQVMELEQPLVDEAAYHCLQVRPWIGQQIVAAKRGVQLVMIGSQYLARSCYCARAQLAAEQELKLVTMQPGADGSATTPPVCKYFWS